MATQEILNQVGALVSDLAKETLTREDIYTILRKIVACSAHGAFLDYFCIELVKNKKAESNWLDINKYIHALATFRVKDDIHAIVVKDGEQDKIGSLVDELSSIKL